MHCCCCCCCHHALLTSEPYSEVQCRLQLSGLPLALTSRLGLPNLVDRAELQTRRQPPSPSFGTGTGIQWRNMGSVWGDFSFTQVLVMLLLDSFLYCLVAFLVESLFPRKIGMPKSWYIFAKVSSESATLQTDVKFFLSVIFVPSPRTGVLIKISDTSQSLPWIHLITISHPAVGSGA